MHCVRQTKKEKYKRMKTSRAEKASLNVATGLLAEIVTLVCGLILPRLILSHFGSSYNGITSSAQQFLSLIAILNVGIAGSTRVALYQTLSRNDTSGTSAIVRATEQYMRKVAMVLAAYIVILSLTYPVFVETGFEYWDVAILVIAAGANSFGSYFFGAAYQALLSADQCVYITNVLNIITTILNTVIAAFLISAGFSIQVVKLSSAIVYILKPALQNLYVSRKYRIDKTVKPDSSALSKRKDVMAHSIANIVHDNTDIVILNLFCDVKIASVYTVYNLVMAALRNFLRVFTNGTEAIFGSMWAKGEKEQIQKSIGYYEFIMGTMVSTVFATTMIMILPFVFLYTKGINDVEYILPTYAMVITVAQAFFCLRSPYLALVQGAGKYKETKQGAVLEAALNLGISFILVQFLGIVGTAIGTLVANMFRTIQYAVYIQKNICQRSIKTIICRLGWGFFNLICVCLSCGQLTLRYTEWSWGAWIICGFLTFILSCLITIISALVFYRKDLFAILGIIKRVINKRRILK